MSGHGHVDPSNKKIALLIAVLALFLAISETLSKAYQTEVITKQVEASNLWAFFQAKSIRKTSTDLAIQSAQIQPSADEAKTAAMIKRWTDASKRYDSEPETGEGRQELMARAKKAESSREVQKAKGDIFDISSALLQIGIVLASSAVITGAIALAWVAGALGVFGTALMAIAATSPMLIGSIF